MGTPPYTPNLTLAEQGSSSGAGDRVRRDVEHVQGDLERIWSAAWASAATSDCLPLDAVLELRREYQEKTETLEHTGRGFARLRGEAGELAAQQSRVAQPT